jgi:hypothetical protein
VWCSKRIEKEKNQNQTEADQPQIALCLVCSLPSARVVRGACK